MSDLISRKKVIDILEKEKSLKCGYDADIAIFSIEKGIRELPTAYDVNKVVEELEERQQEYLEGFGVHDNNELYGVACGLGDAIKIVKKGGASDDVCEWIKYDYRTICPKNHDTKTPYWRIPDDMDKLKYCPYCGKRYWNS